MINFIKNKTKIFISKLKDREEQKQWSDYKSTKNGLIINYQISPGLAKCLRDAAKR